MSVSRREFFCTALVGLLAKADRPVAGSFVNESAAMGHRLRDRAAFPAPKSVVRAPVVIVGGGIAGLSAAWRLEKRGFRDFVVLEMERQAGGNARWGENEVSRYPWAAHYVPVPGRRSALVRELMEEFGVLRDGRWEERFLCFSPQERMFIHGRWQEGFEPAVGATRRDYEQYRRFEARIAEFRASGQFTIPMEDGARPSPLDAISIAEWLKQNEFDSKNLTWYVNYCCRDDYGALASDVSAWAGIHYYASRAPEEKGPLTWPEGNGWLLQKLLAKLGGFVRGPAMVHRIAREGSSFHVLAGEVEYRCEAVIFAAPSFLAPYIVDRDAGLPDLRGFAYSPWLTANLTLDRLPASRHSEVAWDNVIFDSPALGYVDATHQSLRTFRDRSVWTFYWALAEGPPAQNRELLLARDWHGWKEAILNDLSRAHPDIRACVSRVDIMRLGHAMIRPTPGFMFSGARPVAARRTGRFVLANSDISGLSLFEEAQHRGVKAAEHVLHQLGRAGA